MTKFIKSSIKVSPVHSKIRLTRRPGKCFCVWWPQQFSSGRQITNNPATQADYKCSSCPLSNKNMRNRALESDRKSTGARRAKIGVQANCGQCLTRLSQSNAARAPLGKKKLNRLDKSTAHDKYPVVRPAGRTSLNWPLGLDEHEIRGGH